jgi:predicted DNA-binding antitoxin AbrB/MazE fold protein
MTQTIHAIYENGVFRPLEPVILTDCAKVSLTVSDALEATDDDAASAAVDAVERQRQALANLRSEMDALPPEALNDGLGGANHDLILYGWKK